jgi:bidirectional [NiFe] hydrogenase diaphorase subunit
MERLMTLEELEQIASEARAAKEKFPRELNVCVAAGCLSLHSDTIKTALEKEVQRAGVNCRVRGTGCMGLCSLGPLVSSEPKGVLLKNVAEADAAEIVANLEQGAPERLR